MEEELLYRCPVILKKQSFDLFLTSDRIVLQPSQGSVSEAVVVPLSMVSGHQKNTPKGDLTNAKSLIKIFLRTDQGEQFERVLDFIGETRFDDQAKIDQLLKSFSGDAATARQTRISQEAEALAKRRAKFLLDRPHMKALYERLVEKDSAITSEEFWNRYSYEVECNADMSKSTGNFSGLPVPLKPPTENSASSAVIPALSALSGNLSGFSKKENIVTAERARMIFSQYPEVSELYSASVPHLISEKDFWRRFFQCQFFWRSQGNDRETCRDPVFDALTKKTVFTPGNKEQNFMLKLPPGGLAVDPSIDLSTEYAGESKQDRATAVEIGSLTGNEGFATLAKRFNDYASHLVDSYAKQDRSAPSVTTIEELEKLAEVRRAEIERELDDENHTEFSDAIRSDLPKLIHSFSIQRQPAGNVWDEISNNQNGHLELHANMPGVTEAIVELSAALVSRKSAGIFSDDQSKAVRALAQTKENSELDLMCERVNELLRHFWATNPEESDRRSRIVHALTKQKDEVDSWLTKAGPQWSAAAKVLVEPIIHAEKTSKFLSTR